MTTALRIAFTVALFLYAVAAGAAAAAAGASTSTTSALDEIAALSRRTPLVAVRSGAAFARLVLDAPRAHSVMLLFTSLASAAARQCSSCRQLHAELAQTARWYEDHRNCTTRPAGSGSAARQCMRHSLFFVSVDVGDATNAEWVRRLSLQALPALLLIGPADGPAAASLGAATFLSQTPAALHFHAKRWGLSFRGIQAFIAARANIPPSIVPAPVPPDETALWALALVALACMCFAGWQMLLSVAPHAALVWHDPMLWCTLAVGAFVCLVSGSVFGLLRAGPFVGRQPKALGGGAQFFARDIASQLGGESFAIAGLVGASALALILVNSGAFADAHGRVRPVVHLIAMTLVYALFYGMRAAYTLKNEHAAMGFPTVWEG